MKSRVCLSLVAAALFPHLAAAASPTPPPNIVFIMVDEMRWNVMSCEGHPFVQTPHLDRLGRSNCTHPQGE